MMSRKTYSLLCVVLALGLVSSSHGALIGDFETGLDGWLENDATISQSTTGATVGSNAMSVTGVGGWHINCRLDAKSLSSILGSPGAAITADVTVFDADITGGWMQVEMVINGQNNDDNGANNNIDWNPLGLQNVTRDGQPHTYEWVLPSDLATAIAGVDENIAWFELMLVTNLDGGSGMQAYVDNINAVPEPATIALLGMGGLALLRRRR
jgi:hypothetical protein